MATITFRIRADSTKSYRAAIRLKRKGKVVYRESPTFGRKVFAKDRTARRELELQERDAVETCRRERLTNCL